MAIVEIGDQDMCGPLKRISESLAPLYDRTQSYSKDAIVMFNGIRYKAKQNVPASETFNKSLWDKESVQTAIAGSSSGTPKKIEVGPYSIDATGTAKRPDVFTSTPETGVTVTGGSLTTLDPYWDVDSSCWVLSRHNEQINLNGSLVGGAGKFTTRTGHETATSTTLEFYGPASEGYGSTKFFTVTVSTGSNQGSVVVGFDSVGGVTPETKNGVADLSPLFSIENDALNAAVAAKVASICSKLNTETSTIEDVINALQGK